MSFSIYKKDGQAVLPDFQANAKLNDPALYIPSDALVDAVNVALSLGQPLLLTGEPGTGKTQLAYHIAHYFQLKEPLVFNAQTTSVATDLFTNTMHLDIFNTIRITETPSVLTKWKGVLSVTMPSAKRFAPSNAPLF